MEREEYRLMFESEQDHWWYKGLHDLVSSVIKAVFGDKTAIRILDAGCGTGFMLKLLDKYGEAWGIDISSEALGYCRTRALNRILRASVMHIPFQNETFDAVISNDVLYHNLVFNDELALREFHRVLKDKGVLIMNLPAHNFLRRAHDERVHTRHRYARAELRSMLQRAGFKIEKITYRSAFLLFAVLLLRLTQNKNYKEAESDLKPMSNIPNSILYGVLKTENLLLKIADIPMGTSLFCLSKKGSL